MELFPTPLITTKIEENTDELKLSNKFTRNNYDQNYNYVQHKDGKRILEDYRHMTMFRALNIWT